jgi:hypothetical protein
MTEKEKERLIDCFNALKKIDEKFNFWMTELKRPYYLWASINYSEIEPFIIHPENKKETELINIKCIELYIDRAERISPKKRVLIFDNLREDFLEKYKSEKNKSKLIEIEKANNEKIKEENQQNRFPFLFQERLFNKAFNDFYINNNIPDLSDKVYEIEELISINNGYVLAQYSFCIDELLKKPYLAKGLELTHIQQMLILDYLDIGKHIKNDTKKADIYAPLIRRDWETTRQYFYELEYGKNMKNLDTILEYFEKGGFSNQVELVKKDIDRAKKRK